MKYIDELPKTEQKALTAPNIVPRASKYKLIKFPHDSTTIKVLFMLALRILKIQHYI